jgi:hypothetical protein
MALQTQQCNETVKISEANSWRMVYNVTTSRETSQQTIRHAYISTLKKLGFEGEKGQLREWMTVARDISAWGRKVECQLREWMTVARDRSAWGRKVECKLLTASSGNSCVYNMSIEIRHMYEYIHRDED